jgi:hypothetical protein
MDIVGGYSVRYKVGDLIENSFNLKGIIVEVRPMGYMIILWSKSGWFHHQVAQHLGHSHCHKTFKVIA